ncbi:ubiquitin carboxyl-terminal hydrolase 38 isoform X2 [Topomyia yanbarensis]|nr:ubiquitin carboxyl-terminal hydrolase 38 isoform X2 [Topomyia yanbarensis]XP_058820539.1 ubiquitin carboxyl-terminal hydrolase 38 isoform X2 [Topomyia yanbarensis]XP_058820540.1 ubiquitin carboxyl-terminal hydrolase 38 isoform X2 [Topomyia yanbarensis]
MAVKQHVTELAHNKQMYDINKILEIIDILLASPDAIPTNVTNLKQLCEKIVEHLIHTSAERETAEIKRMTPEIQKVSEFFRGLVSRVPSNQYDEILIACLEMLYKQIKSCEETSNYASAVLALVDKSMIKNGVQWILQQTDNTNETKRIFKTLSHWLETWDFAPDLTMWVNEILVGLRDQQKPELVLELSLSIIVSYFSKLILPIFRPKLGPIVLCILKSNQHTSAVFQAITPAVPMILMSLSKDDKANAKQCNLFQNLVDILSALLLKYPSCDHSYNEMKNCLQKYPRSKNFQQTLDVPPWRDSSQNFSTVTTNARVGLVNLGNTCYMNSVLQALVMTKQFSREILLSKIEAPLFSQIQKLLAFLLHSARPELTPRALLAAARPPDFVPGFQQDSSEFLGYLLEKLHETEKKTLMKNQYLERSGKNKRCWSSEADGNSLLEISNSKIINGINLPVQQYEGHYVTEEAQYNESLLPPTLIQKTFDGKLFVTYECKECGSQSTNSDAFRSFELSFPEPNELGADYSVQKLLDFYCSSEKLIGDNQYFCDKCKRLCDGERSIRILKSPRNLILTLKHFRYDQQRHTRAKLMNKVLHDEAISLRIVSEINPPSVVHYSLYAAVVHAGTSMDSGHYYTYAQDESDCWYKFNDNYVTKCSADELHSLSSPNTPYILFYQMLMPSAAHNLDMDEEMDEPTAIVKTASNNAASNSATDCQLPEFEELPPRLRDIILGDNESYNEEMQNEDRKLARVGTNKLVLPKNHDSDNDDPPPNSCGSQTFDLSDRFIC